MGRLEHSGSSIAFRQKLFPDGFAAEVIQLVHNTWKSFEVDPQVRIEPRITALFHRALIDAFTVAGRTWFLVLEEPITDPNFGTELGRNDLRFYPQAHQSQTVFFSVECKKLRVKHNGRMRHLTKQYTDEGVQRFVDGKYSAGLAAGGMLGYVMDNDVESAFEAVKTEINSKRVALKLTLRDGMAEPSCLLPGLKTSIDTRHTRDDGVFTLHHLLVGIPPNPKSKPRKKKAA